MKNNIKNTLLILAVVLLIFSFKVLEDRSKRMEVTPDSISEEYMNYFNENKIKAGCFYIIDTPEGDSIISKINYRE